MKEAELVRRYGWRKHDGVMLDALTPGELMRAYEQLLVRHEVAEELHRRELLMLTPVGGSVGHA